MKESLKTDNETIKTKDTDVQWPGSAQLFLLASTRHLCHLVDVIRKCCYVSKLLLRCCADCVYRAAVTPRARVPRENHPELRKKSKSVDYEHLSGFVLLLLFYYLIYLSFNLIVQHHILSILQCLETLNSFVSKIFVI